MRSENIIEEGVNGLCLFTKLSVSLRAQSSLQVRKAAEAGKIADAFVYLESLMENIDLIAFLFHLSFRPVSLLQVLYIWHAGCTEP